MTILKLDYEVRSEIDLPTRGLDVYSAHPSTQIILAAYTFDDDKNIRLWDYSEGQPFPAELREAIEDPEVIKTAFNAQFERTISSRVGKMPTPIRNWYCTMVRAYLLSFSGNLGAVGEQMGLSGDKVKDKRGKDLIRKFCMPQRVTKNQPFRWRDPLTDPDDWEIFREYCRQDVVSEDEINRRLIKFPIPADEWHLYWLDQKINDRGLPVNMQYVESAIWMAAHRKDELQQELNRTTGLSNGNSSAQMLPWLQAQGYPFNDLQADTVKKVLRENGETLPPVAVRALELRQNANRTSTAKYNAFRESSGETHDGSTFRFAFQFAGATRTARWAGRRVQAQNLPRTPKEIEDLLLLTVTTKMIERGDLDGLHLMIGEPMTALVGCIRSAIQAPMGKELRVCDLSSIETCVIAWLSNCERLLKVIHAGYDAYKDFGVILYKGVYADFGTPEYEAAYPLVTKTERTNSKPAVLGAGYRLGGGDLMEGKRTGLWGYAENMGVELTKEESHRAVKAYRDNYPEVPALWRTYEDAAKACLRTEKDQIVGPLVFSYKKPFLTVKLPSGRHMYYFQPAMRDKTFHKTVGWNEDGSEIIESWTKSSFTYMGQDQKSGKWVRIFSHGGKLVENFVQAIARDILKYGLLDADAEGFDIRGHVHDEIIASEDILDDRLSVELLGECMTRPRDWAPGLPLGYGGWQGKFYRKD